MVETLEEVKERLKGHYLGKAGIHGMGISRTQGAIRVYVSTASGPNQTDILEQIRQEAEPFGVIVIREDRPQRM
ncbi:MAG: hypothetical protein ACRERE_22345 [Candidatus Entotheonellia bacterium]